MSFMPLQPIVPLTDPSKNAQVESFFADGQKNQPGPHQLPFENYLQQALVGVNDSVINMAQGYQRVLSGDVNYLPEPIGPSKTCRICDSSCC